MLISFAPPPLPMADLYPEQLGFDPTMLATSILGPISNYFVAKEQSKTAKKAIALEAKKMKDARDADARDFAYSTAQTTADNLARPDEDKRKEQLVILTAVGGVAVVISILFIIGSMKAGKVDQ